MAAPSSGALTTAGYTQSPTGVWTQMFGTITVIFSTVAGTLTVSPSTDNNASDIANASASLASLGYPAIGPNASLGSAGGTQVYGQSL